MTIFTFQDTLEKIISYMENWLELGVRHEDIYFALCVKLNWTCPFLVPMKNIIFICFNIEQTEVK